MFHHSPMEGPAIEALVEKMNPILDELGTRISSVVQPLPDWMQFCRGSRCDVFP
jgi:hypothetical protein